MMPIKQMDMILPLDFDEELPPYNVWIRDRWHNTVRIHKINMLINKSTQRVIYVTADVMLED